MKIAFGMNNSLTTFALVRRKWLDAQPYPSPGLTHGGLRASDSTVISATYDTWLDFDLALSILEQTPEMSDFDDSPHVGVLGRNGHEILLEVRETGLDRFASSLRTSPLAWITSRQRNVCLTFRSQYFWGCLGEMSRRRTTLLAGVTDDVEGADILRYEAEKVADEAAALFRSFWGVDPDRAEIHRLLASAASASMPGYPKFADAFALWLLPAIARGEDERLFAMNFSEVAYLIDAVHRRLTGDQATEVLVCLVGFYE